MIAEPEAPDVGGETYSAAEVAELMAVHVKTVRGWFRSGHLPAIKVGGTWRITAAALDLAMRR